MSADHPFREHWLEAELRRVTPPAGLVARLQQIPVDADEDLDAVLRETPLPAGLMGRLRRIPFAAAPRERHWTRFERQAVAASLVSMVWFSYVAALLLFWLDFRPQQTATADWLRTESPLEPEPLLGEGDLLGESEPALVVGAAPNGSSGKGWSAPLAMPAPAVVDDMPEERLTPEMADPPGETLAVGFPVDMASLLRASPAAPGPAAAEVPAGPHFDRSFLSRTGVFPRVDPQHHPSARVPLSAETASFDFAREALRRGRFPAPEEIRTEEFLAAIDYGLPRLSQPGVALSAAAGRAAWELPEAAIEKGAVRERSLWLLQFHLQAGTRSGPSPLAASQARLTVRFNPQAVASYRLCGHEPTRDEGAAHPSGLDFLPGGSATAVYELQLRGDAAGEVAAATVEWTDPATGMRRSQRYAIERRQFAPRFEQAPASLRLAGLAAAAGEILRESPHAASISSAAMLELARQGQNQTGPNQANSVKEFRKFVEIFARILALQPRTGDAQPVRIRDAEKAKPAPGPLTPPATVATLVPESLLAFKGQRVSCFAVLESISWNRCPDSQAIVSASGAGTRLSLWRLRVISPAV